MPGTERWWNGSEWTSATHRSPSPSWDWMPAYTRSFWSGLNRPAFIARVVGTIAMLLLLPGILVMFFLPLLSVVIGVIMVGLGITTVVFGVLALQRAEREGGKGLAIWAIAVPLAVVIPCAFVISFVGLVLPPMS